MPADSERREPLQVASADLILFTGLVVAQARVKGRSVALMSMRMDIQRDARDSVRPWVGWLIQVRNGGCW
jgi:hypothetical protein